MTDAEAKGLSSKYHDIWMEENSWRKEKEGHLFKPYDELTAAEKIKDVEVLESTLKSSGIDVTKQPGFQAYKANVQREVFVESGGAAFAKQVSAIGKKMDVAEVNYALDYVRSADEALRKKFIAKVQKNSEAKNIKLINDIKKVSSQCTK